jgi:hypothetical protein
MGSIVATAVAGASSTGRNTTALAKKCDRLVEQPDDRLGQFDEAIVQFVPSLNKAVDSLPVLAVLVVGLTRTGENAHLV